MSAGIARGELENIQARLKTKFWMAKKYNSKLKDIRGLSLPVTMPGVINVFWMYAVTIDKKYFGMDRDIFADRLSQKGVQTRNFFYPPNIQPVLLEKGCVGKADRFPVSEDISKRGLYLPSGLAITSDQIDYVCETIRSLMDN